MQFLAGFYPGDGRSTASFRKLAWAEEVGKQLKHRRAPVPVPTTGEESMSEPFLAEIMIVGFNFAPRGWAQCDGQILPINQNQSLYSLLGTTYGGDGRTSFALPDLRSRTPIHKGSSNGGINHQLGQKGGVETVALDASEMPTHTHTFHVAKADATEQRSGTAQGSSVLAKSNINLYRAYNAATEQDLSTQAAGEAGGGQAHNNMMPYQALNYCIALQGLFPSRN
jgi:microcystin-dependent protein